MPLGNHTLLLSQEGDLWAFGWNCVGQLGLGHTNDEWQPVKVSWNGPVPVQVDWGRSSSLVLDAEGAVWDAGRCRSFTCSPAFQRLPNLPSIASVAAGSAHCAALDTNGGLWVWTSVPLFSWADTVPKQVEGLPTLLKVACGGEFLVAEAEEGDVWVLGLKGYSQPIIINADRRSKGPLRSLAALDAGMILVDFQGAVFSAGNNSHGQLGPMAGFHSKFERVDNIPVMVTASCGYEQSFFLDEDGRVWTWGPREAGPLGTNGTSDLHSSTQVPLLEGISGMVAGAFHFMAFPKSGGMLVSGGNNYGQLGLNHRIDQRHPELSPLKLSHPSSACSRSKSARFL